MTDRSTDSARQARNLDLPKSETARFQIKETMSRKQPSFESSLNSSMNSHANALRDDFNNDSFSKSPAPMSDSTNHRQQNLRSPTTNTC